MHVFVSYQATIGRKKGEGRRGKGERKEREGRGKGEERERDDFIVT